MGVDSQIVHEPWGRTLPQGASGPLGVTVRAMTEAWDAAASAAASAGVRLGELDALRDADAVNGVIGRVWGEQPIGRELLRAMQHAGCSFHGAWDADGWGEAADGSGPLIGYVLGFVGAAGGVHLHSHMLAVIPEWRSRGTGLALKLAQRAWALDHGLDEIRWTFDPLLLGNARFNLVRLGTIAARYLPDFYGAMEDDLNRGERTDRFEVSWLLTSNRVAKAIAPSIVRSVEVPPDAAEVLSMRPNPGGGAPEPWMSGLEPGIRAVVAVPPDHLSLRREDPALAHRWREASGEAFAACFDHGMIATGATRDGRYVFERVDPLEVSR
jgi:predicted GNAT superfamily acetyltransferase